MSIERLFINAKIASEDRRELIEADVWVDETGVIRGIGSGLRVSEKAQVFDCKGKIILPALFDVHVHVREPGREDKETIESGSEAAINGGVTGVVAMPNTTPAIDSGGMVRFIHALAKEKSRIPVLTSGCITRNREGKELAEIADMVDKGAVMITDDGSPVDDPYVLMRAMEYASTFDLIVASHCETMTLSGEGAMNEGLASYKLGIPGIPACSEEICIGRDVRLAQHTGARLHIQHVTTAAGMELIRRFKEEGVKVTCEVSPHHLIFNEEDIQEYDTNYKMNPPLRTARDNELLLQGLSDGVVDVIATDHAPHTSFEKNFDFAHAPFGITGLETALISLYTHFIRDGRMGWDVLVKRFSAEPRRLIHLEPVPVEEGLKAEFIVFDPNAITKVDRGFMKSKSLNTPFLNKELQGSVEKVVLAEKVLLDRVQTNSVEMVNA